MKVLDLACANGHRFEGWFASAEDFASQNERRLVACPLCGDSDVKRQPSAPRISVSRGAEPAAPAARAAGEPAAAAPAPAASTELTLQSQWLRAVRHVMAHTEDVGERFADEARKIHYGEVEERGIRGKASKEDAEALKAEGIEVMSLPIPDALKGPVQ